MRDADALLLVILAGDHFYESLRVAQIRIVFIVAKLFEKRWIWKSSRIIGMDSETLSADEEVDKEFAKETDERARNIVKTRGASWTHATSETAVPVGVKVFKVESLPTKVLIDREGKVVARIKEGKELDEILAALLRRK